MRQMRLLGLPTTTSQPLCGRCLCNPEADAAPILHPQPACPVHPVQAPSYIIGYWLSEWLHVGYIAISMLLGVVSSSVRTRALAAGFFPVRAGP